MGLGNPKMGLSPGASQNECISWGIPKRVHVLRNPKKGPSLGDAAVLVQAPAMAGMLCPSPGPVGHMGLVLCP